VTAEVQPLVESVETSPRSLRAVLLDRAFPALRHRDFRLFFYGQLISLVGTWTQQVAQAWLVWTISHSPLMLGVITGLQSLPVLLFGLWGGVAADRIDKRLLLIGTQIASGLLALSLAVLSATGVVSAANPNFGLGLVGGIAFALGTVNAFDAPTRQAFVVELVGKKHLLNAISLNSSIFNGARILGPAMAGILIALVGVSICFYINAASFVPVIVGLYLIRRPRLAVTRARASVGRDLGEALTYAWREPAVRDLCLTVVTTSLLVFSYASILPAFADHVFHAGAGGFSTLTVAAGVGSLVGAFTLAVRSHRRQALGTWIVAGSIAYCVFIGLFALSPVLALAIPLLALGGFAGISYLARCNTALQVIVPDHLRGRVMAIYVLLLMGVAPVGAIQLGVLAHVVGPPRAVAIECAVAAALLLILHLRRPIVRQLD
jgi:MFS family permease